MAVRAAHDYPPGAVGLGSDKLGMRYLAHLEVHVSAPGRTVVTVTRELSRTSLFFYVEPQPAAGERLRATLFPEGHEPVAIDVVVRYVIPGAGAGADVVQGAPGEPQRLAALVEALSGTAGWRPIVPPLVSAEEGDASAELELEQKELIDVGGTGEAYRVFFERYPPVAPEATALAENTEAVLQARQLLAGVSSEPVRIKLHGRDRVRTAHLGALLRGPGFVAIVPPPHRLAAHAFYALSGREQLLVREGGRAVFPFLTTSDRARIQRDTTGDTKRPSSSESATAPSASAPGVLRAPGSTPDVARPPTAGATRAREREHTLTRAGREVGDPPAAPGPVERARSAEDKARDPLRGPAPPSTALGEWRRVDDPTVKILGDLFDILHAETRVYNVGGVERPVRILRNLTVLVREIGGPEQEALLLHDGRRVCALVGFANRDPLRVRPLRAHDEIRVPAW